MSQLIDDTIPPNIETINDMVVQNIYDTARMNGDTHDVAYRKARDYYNKHITPTNTQ